MERKLSEEDVALQNELRAFFENDVRFLKQFA